MGWEAPQAWLSEVDKLNNGRKVGAGEDLAAKVSRNACWRIPDLSVLRRTQCCDQRRVAETSTLSQRIRQLIQMSSLTSLETPSFSAGGMRERLLAAPKGID